GGRGGEHRHHGRQRRKEQTEQEQDSDHHGGQAGASARDNPRRTFHVAGGGRGPEGGTGHGRGAVCHQGPAQARQIAFLIQQVAFVGGADQGAGGVEQVNEQERKDHADQAHVQGAGNIHLHESRSQAGRG